MAGSKTYNNPPKGLDEEDRMRVLAIFLIKDAVDKIQHPKSNKQAIVLKTEAILFLRSKGAGHILEELGLDQEDVLSRLNITEED